MKDVSKIKIKLLETIQRYKETINENSQENMDDELDQSQFNAAEYTFVSTRVAKEFPALKESQIILRYSTPWPKQSYGSTKSVSSSYSKKFSFISKNFYLNYLYF